MQMSESVWISWLCRRMLIIRHHNMHQPRAEWPLQVMETGLVGRWALFGEGQPSSGDVCSRPSAPEVGAETRADADEPCRDSCARRCCCARDGCNTRRRHTRSPRVICAVMPTATAVLADSPWQSCHHQIERKILCLWILCQHCYCCHRLWNQLL